jgi:hypothetical protein
MSSARPSHRVPDPTRALLRAGLILCGVALTWACAAFGLFWMTAPRGCRSPNSVKYQVADLASAVATYQIERNRCPITWNELLPGGYVAPRFLVDYWGTRIAFSCSEDEILVTSAGPDRRFGTGDDIIRPRR